jgi:hypothetical protein
MKRNGHKFNAVRTEIDGISFASKAEAKRYGELKMLEKAGQIAHLSLQPKFPLYVWDCEKKHEVQIGHWVGDFQYWDMRAHRTVIEDVKGVRTPVYRLKKKMIEHRLGIEITEIGRATKATKAKRAVSTRRSEAQKKPL